SDMLDFGAESTRPGHQPLDEATELARLMPVLERFRARDKGTIVSIDTFKPAVFRRAHAAGGDILNSIWGLDDALLDVAVDCGVPVIAMHNKAKAVYQSVVDEVLASLGGMAERAVKRGMKVENVILDPGIGFGKTADHNLEVLGALDRVVALGFPTLLGTSRKSTIGKLTGKPVTDRVYGTAATVALAAAAGIDIVRVHDVEPARDVLAVTDAVVRKWRPEGWGTR
ncbi:MAG: dihydropteroate synthase, partial [Vulcanimicrobiaceae bacterium]